MRMPPGASRRLQLLWAAFTGRLGHQTRNPLLWLTWSALLGQLAREPARSIALTWAAVLLLPDLDSWCVLVRPHKQSNAVWLCSQLTQGVKCLQAKQQGRCTILQQWAPSQQGLHGQAGAACSSGTCCAPASASISP